MLAAHGVPGLLALRATELMWQPAYGHMPPPQESPRELFLPGLRAYLGNRCCAKAAGFSCAGSLCPGQPPPTFASLWSWHLLSWQGWEQEQSGTQSLLAA